MKTNPEPPYPWGTETPGPRLRATAARARTGIEQVQAPGTHRQIADRIDGAVQKLYPLVDALDHLARAGLRTRGSNKNAIDGRSVATAVEAVREALAAMAGSTATTLSGHFDAFATAVEALIALSETGIELGITGTGEADAHDPWKAYGAGPQTPKLAPRESARSQRSRP